MKHLLYLCFSLLVLPPILRADDQPPSRKAGLWEFTISVDGGAPKTSKQCIDEQTDLKMQKMATEIGNNCTQLKTNKTGSFYSSEATCRLAATKIVAKASFTGDFNSSYVGDSVTSYDPPFAGKNETKSHILAKWIGPCEAGQKPGDIILSNGAKMNINDLARLPHAPPPAQTK